MCRAVQWRRLVEINLFYNHHNHVPGIIIHSTPLIWWGEEQHQASECAEIIPDEIINLSSDEQVLLGQHLRLENSAANKFFLLARIGNGLVTNYFALVLLSVGEPILVYRIITRQSSFHFTPTRNRRNEWECLVVLNQNEGIVFLFLRQRLYLEVWFSYFYVSCCSC